MISRGSRLQEITGLILGQLVHLRPMTNLLKVLAFMAGADVDKGLGIFGVDPDMAQYTSVNRAHQLLPDNIKAACWQR